MNSSFAKLSIGRPRAVVAAMALCALAALAGCAHEATTPVQNAPGATNGATATSTGVAPSDTPPEMAPTPYTAAQIRDSNRPGTVYRFKLEAAGQPAQIKVLEFTSGTNVDRAEVKSVTLDETGKAKAAPEVEHTRWDDLRKHAEFPRAALKVEPGSIEVPAGKFEAMVYTVTAPNGETAKFYFAKSYAGPPVLMVKERGGARVMTMTLMERKAAP